MKKFIRNILLFIIPFIGGIIYIYLNPFDKKYGYSYRDNVDCNTSWIYYRLFENPQPIDIAFLGTSHTGCGINDSLIEKLVSKQINHPINIANLAYCTKGRNIQYPLIKDLLSTKKPKLIIIEVAEEEDKYSHQDFGYIADFNDVVKADIGYNFDYFKNLYSSLNCRFNFYRKSELNLLNIKKPANYNQNHSYVPFNFFAEEKKLEKHLLNQQKRYKKKLSYFVSDFKFSYPKKYVTKIVSLAKRENIKVVFLYIPSYGYSIEKPLEYDFYKGETEIILPPDTIFTNKDNWFDSQHLNYKGSTSFAKWLSKELKKNYIVSKEI